MSATNAFADTGTGALSANGCNGRLIATSNHYALGHVDGACWVTLQQTNVTNGGLLTLPWSLNNTQAEYYNDGIHYLRVCIEGMTSGQVACGAWISGP
ncbi:hypothetical protein ACIRVK_42330 [Streptomyces sp. NPDC101152]|uniref:hypothetical protein n=1 Tax=Streptomyces sp. NPDC101152 TaxID=3366116 RepID=UPI00381F079D